MNKFQFIVIGILIAGAAVAMLLFTGIIPGFKDNDAGRGAKLVMWGTFPSEKMLQVINEINEDNLDFFQITYVRKNENTYQNELLEAMASGNSPDIFVFTQDMIFDFKDKIETIPFESFSERNFKDIFADAGELFLDREAKAVVGLPCAIDPMVLYWNRDLFSSSGLAQPPQYWDDFLQYASVLTKKDNAGNIIQSGAAMGEFANVKSAKDILSMMVLQAGNPIISQDTSEIVWEEKGEMPLSPIESALTFYINFSNPRKTSYSWNRSLKNSDEMFPSGSLGMYLGYAGEFNDIKEKNPHLNFDISAVPQIKDNRIKATFGKIHALAISKTAKNKPSAALAMFKLIEKDINKKIADGLFLGPSRRDVLSGGNADSNLDVFYLSSIMARSWLEPNPQEISTIFKNMIESSATGRLKISEAISEATRKMKSLLQ